MKIKNILNNTAIIGVFWSFFQQIGNQLIGFALLIILGRILQPEDYGLMGMIYIIFNVGDVLIDSGFSNSLIRSNKINNNHFSVVFNFNVFIGILFYLLIFIFSNTIAFFYNQPELSMILKIYGLCLILNALISTQQAFLIKRLEFRKISLISFISNIVGAVIGITLAYLKFGVWSLVFTTLSSLLVNLFLIWKFSKFKPKLFYFDLDIFKKHLNFGYKLTLTNLLDAAVRNLFNILLGKFYNSKEVGYYSRANSLKNIFVHSLITAINKVSYPMLSKIQNEEELFTLNYKRIINVLSFCTTPVLAFLALFSDTIIILLFSEKWIEMSPYFQVLCLSGILYPLSAFNVNSLSVKGKSDLVLKIELINKFILVVLIFFAFKKGVLVLISVLIPYSIIEYIVSMIFNNKIINYKIKNQLKDFAKVALIVIISMSVVYLLSIQLKSLNFNFLINFIICLVVYMLIYVFICNKLKIKGLYYIKELLKNKI